ncbi:MAG TPA: sigma-54 dependent transcriptional regulator [Terracidiphilus sp.]|jgi:two-component system response regulator PilR (NtrC family)
MPAAQNVALTASSSPLGKGHPVVCIVAVDLEFVNILKTEMLPWVQVVVRDTYEDLARWTREKGVSAVVLDIDTQGEDEFGGIPVLAELRQLNKDFTLISMTRARARSVESRALEAGADAHFRNPVSVPDLRSILIDTIRKRTDETERETRRQQVLEASRFQDFIGASEPMRRVYDAIQQIAASNINVLIRGESGTGKELVARAIVALSRRANKPFIRLNCAALPENLIESELFGSERGAFTGATESRPGHIELADGGTLFLDEIATLTLPLQTKLLRVLEDHHVQRLGGRTLRKIDFRLICATNEPLEEMVRTGKFREDLYYRIHVIPIQLPPLRERTGDIPILSEHFLQVHCTANGVPVKRISPDALAALEEHTWPGNVRELENLIQRLVITTRGSEIVPTDLPPRVVERSLAASEAILIPDGGTDFDGQIRQLEMALLTTALRRAKGSKTAAARLLNVDVQRMKYLCRKYSL